MSFSTMSAVTTLEAGITHMADFGRIVLCGAIAAYNDAEAPAPGPRNLMVLVARRVQHAGLYRASITSTGPSEALAALAEWVMRG